MIPTTAFHENPTSSMPIKRGARPKAGIPAKETPIDSKTTTNPTNLSWYEMANHRRRPRLSDMFPKYSAPIMAVAPMRLNAPAATIG